MKSVQNWVRNNSFTGTTQSHQSWWCANTYANCNNQVWMGFWRDTEEERETEQEKTTEQPLHAFGGNRTHYSSKLYLFLYKTRKGSTLIHENFSPLAEPAIYIRKEVGVQDKRQSGAAHRVHPLIGSEFVMLNYDIWLHNDVEMLVFHFPDVAASGQKS
jgi:hypothetical protein